MKTKILELENKWGEFVKIGHALCNKQMSFISDKAYLNVLYEPQTTAIQEVFNSFGCNVLPELLTFYKQYNGCSLFFSILNIFGIQSFDKEIYEPYDLEFENRIIQETFKNDNYIFFASLGGDYAFAYKKDECSKVYAVKKGKKKVLKKFDNFELWFSYYFETLYDEYNEEGEKKHPNKRYKEIPALYHETKKFF